MRQRRRLTNTLKWAGTILAVALVGLQIAGVWYGVEYSSRRGFCIGAGAGCLGIYWWDTARYPRDPKSNPGWTLGQAPRAAAVQWWGHLGLYSDLNHVMVPCWMLAAMTAVPTGWLWLHTPRRFDGSCPACKYDLTGNTTGVCPECGKSADGNPADNLNR